jgi:hypothetical protein
MTDQDIVDDLTQAIDGLDAIRPRTMPLTVALGRLRFLRARLEPVKAGSDRGRRGVCRPSRHDADDE